jgi:hypothetical protein
MFKLPGIPDEYYQYCYLFEKEDPESIAKTILEVYHLDSESRYLFAFNARQFILRFKNSTFQTKKLLEMISNSNLF